MADAEDRFECILEPFDTWMVFDAHTGVPAMLGDRLLMALSEAEAAEACRTLNHANENECPCCETGRSQAAGGARES